MDCKRIWVYGSLMEGAFNYQKYLVGKVLSRTSALVKGTLFHQSLKGYPALLEGGGWVHGELLELVDFDRAVMVLDDMENYLGPHHPQNEYERIVTPVYHVAADRWMSAHVYWYARTDLGSDRNPAIPIPEGNWRSYIS